MNMPAYTGERSLYKSTRAYAASPKHAAVREDALVPALAVTYCRNVWPGWAIANTLCGDCAVFDVRHSVSGWQVVQISPWEKQCWDEVVY
jgi:hypothetical protein